MIGWIFKRKPEIGKRKALITGSSGTIGAAVARALPGDAEKIGLDLLPGPHTTHQGDICDSRLLGRLMPGVDVVFHVAALHAPHVGQRSEADFRRVNIDGTEALLGAARAAKVRRFVLTSTTSVYGCTTRVKSEAVWVTEDLPPFPEDIYDVTKLGAEDLCRRASSVDFTVVALRVARCFPEQPYLMAFYRLYRGVDLRDTARAHLLAARATLKPFSIFNISADSPFLRADCQLLWTDPWKVIDQRSPGLRRAFEERRWPHPQRIDRVYVIDKAKRELGYGPEFGVSALLGSSPPLTD